MERAEKPVTTEKVINIRELVSLTLYKCVAPTSGSDWGSPILELGDAILIVNHYSGSCHAWGLVFRGGNLEANLPTECTRISDSSSPSGRFVALESEVLASLLSRLHTCPDFVHLISLGRGGLVDKTGADPEVFVVDDKDCLIPAWQFLPSKPEGSNAIYNGSNAIYNDGFACEFAPNAGGCHEELTSRFQNLLRQIKAVAGRRYPGSHLSWRPVMEIPKTVLDSATDSQVALGCSPSFNAYTGGEAPGLHGIDPRRLPIRVAGCHVHFSGCMGNIHLNQLPDEAVQSIVRAIDAIAGVMSVSLLRGMEDPIRREYYGRAGEYRRPPHGIEWRVLSSAVLASPRLVNLMFDSARFATHFAYGNGLMLESLLTGYSPERIQAIINETDPRLALEFIKENETFYDSFLKHLYTEAVLPTAKCLIHEGAINCLDLSSMEKNWGLNGEEYTPMYVRSGEIQVAQQKGS